MSALIVGLDGWELGENADRRFRRTVVSLLIPFLILAILIPLLKLEGLQRGGGDTLEQRVVTIVPEALPAEQEEEPAPAEEEKPEPEPEKPKPVESPKPQEKPREVVVQPPVPTEAERKEAARKIAQRAGVMAMADQLAALRDPSLQGFNDTRPLTTSIATAQSGTGASGGSSEAIAASAAASSGGIGDVGTSDERRSQAGVGLGQRRTTTVQSPIGAGPDKTRPGQSGDKLLAGRTLEEIQLVFDRNKGAITSIYNRAARENPNLGAGKIVISLTIAPDGSVTACSVVSSTFNDPDLERKIVQRVMLMNFGAKNVPAYTYPNYPINFLPT